MISQLLGVDTASVLQTRLLLLEWDTSWLGGRVLPLIPTV